MSDIKIRRAHALTPKHARKAAEKMSERLSEAFDMEFVWEGEVLRFQRSGVDGQLTLGDQEVMIDAQLGFLLAMMKPTIEQSIHENLDKIFGASKKAKPRKAAPKKK
ncbi:MAG: polyhydroxyalkanoic acid system family protein [Acidobacteriota bacterium]